MSKEPMPLENLPEYLKNLKAEGRTNGSPVVGTGQIIVENSSTNWIRNLAFAVMLCLFVGTSSMIAYNQMSTKNLTVTLTASNASPELISKLINDGGGQVVSVKQNEDNSYEVKIATKKSKKSFLDFLKRNKDVKNAQLESDQ